jgi:hypothetical protein
LLPFHTLTTDTQMIEDTPAQSKARMHKHAERTLGAVASAAQAANVSCLISAFGRLQNFFWCFTNGEGVSRSYKCNDRPSVPNFVSEERGRIVEIYMDDLPICVRAFDPGPHCGLPKLLPA